MAYCQICGYEREENLEKSCGNCRGRKSYFGWYLLPNESFSLNIAIIIILIAVAALIVMLFYMRLRENALIVSTMLPTFQALTCSFYRG